MMGFLNKALPEIKVRLNLEHVWMSDDAKKY